MPQSVQSMYIHLKGLKLYAFHGVFAQENQIGTEYTINLSLKTDFSQAAQNDDLQNTVNYGEIYQTVKEEMKTPSKLLEHVSARIAQRILRNFVMVEEVHIELYKQNPPMGADCAQVGIEATYHR